MQRSHDLTINKWKTSARKSWKLWQVNFVRKFSEHPPRNNSLRISAGSFKRRSKKASLATGQACPKPTSCLTYPNMLGNHSTSIIPQNQMEFQSWSLKWTVEPLHHFFTRGFCSKKLRRRATADCHPVPSSMKEEGFWFLRTKVLSWLTQTSRKRDVKFSWTRNFPFHVFPCKIETALKINIIKIVKSIDSPIFLWWIHGKRSHLSHYKPRRLTLQKQGPLVCRLLSLRTSQFNLSSISWPSKPGTGRFNQGFETKIRFDCRPFWKPNKNVCSTCHLPIFWIWQLVYNHLRHQNYLSAKWLAPSALVSHF